MWRVIAPQRWRPVTKRSTLEALFSLLGDRAHRRFVFEHRGRQRIIARAAEVLSIPEEELMSRLAARVAIPYMRELRAYTGYVPVTDEQLLRAQAVPVECGSGMGIACLDPVGLDRDLARLVNRDTLFISSSAAIERAFKSRAHPPLELNRSMREADELARSLVISAARRAWSCQCSRLSVVIGEDAIRIAASDVCSRIDLSLTDALVLVLRRGDLSWCDENGSVFRLSVEFPSEGSGVFATIAIVSPVFGVPQSSVVIIDRDLQFAEVLCRYLQRRGFSVSTFGSPSSACASLEGGAPVVVVRDLCRGEPLVDTGDASRRLVPMDVPTLVLLSEKSAAVKLEALRQGAIATFQKDEDPEFLVAALSNLCQLASR